MANAQPQMTQAQMIAQDQMLAQQLIANSTEYYTQQAPVTSTGLPTSPVSLSLPNSGIMLSCDLDISIAVNITAAATANPIGAYGAVRNVSTYDWYGNARTNVSGSRLNSLNQYRQGRPYDKVPSGFSYDTNNLLYNLPTATGAGTISFKVHIPFAQGGGSLAGALLTQTSNGSCSIQLGFIQNLVSATNPHAPYSAGTMTVGAVTITPTYRYLMPVTFAAANLPLLSLSTAYSVQEIITPQNLSVGQQNLTNFPAARTVFSQIADYVNGSQANFGSDLTNMSIIVNGATPVKQWTPSLKLIEQRNLLGADDIPGRYYFGFRSRPINTNTFGSYQLQFVPSLVNTGAYLVVASEMTYPMGVPLPGLSV